MRRSAGPLTNGIHRLMAAVAVLAQVALVAAPLADVHPAPRPAPIAISAATAAPVAGSSRTDEAPHDPTRCPACIAHSIHAQLSRTPVIAFRDLEHRVATESGTRDGISRPAPSSHHSRAPPAHG